MTEKMHPFRQLLKPGSSFQWNEHLNNLFEESKAAIISEIEEGVQIFDPRKRTCLATDWSKTGIGFWLLQKHCACPSSEPFCCKSGWKITFVGSRFTHAAESRYAPVEGEALAVADALDKARYFVLGCEDLIIAVDHKPLLKIFGDRHLEDISNSRLRNLKEKTLRYRFRMVHIQGIKNRAADGVSRHPTGKAEMMTLPDDIAAINPANRRSNPSTSILAGLRTAPPSEDSIEEDVISAASSSINSLNVKSVTWERVRTATTSDSCMRKLVDIIESGFPETCNELPNSLREYYQFRDDLCTVDGVALYRDRVVVPPTLRY